VAWFNVLVIEYFVRVDEVKFDVVQAKKVPVDVLSVTAKYELGVNPELTVNDKKTDPVQTGPTPTTPNPVSSATAVDNVAVPLHVMST
jgi:hypothetical protein